VFNINHTDRSDPVTIQSGQMLQQYIFIQTVIWHQRATSHLAVGQNYL